MFNLAVYSGHNASITISQDDTILEVLEIERFANYKNAGLMWFLPMYDPTKTIKEILLYFKIKYGAQEYENLMCNQDDTAMYQNVYKGKDNFVKLFNAKNLIEVHHQEAHAYGAFYQSDLQDANIITFDGGGNDGCFNFYKANRNAGVTFTRMDYEYNLGERYAEIGQYSTSIKREESRIKYLVYPGKLMGLCGYGEVKEAYIEPIRNFYKGHQQSEELKNLNYKTLQSALNLPDELSGQIELDIAATSQKVFEDIFYEVSKKEIEESNDNLILSGGCALNILNNTKVNNITKTFVPANPNDCGLSLGFMLKYLKPKKEFDTTYMGPEVWDRFQLSEYIHNYKGTALDEAKIIEDIIIGKILGIVQGRSEIGPRALGNRSIICNPCLPGMKDTLNAKVKNREYYRPFAPIVRLEDVNKYFEFNQESRWMSYCPKVKKEYIDVLKAITHVDGTARVQTVTKDQNELLYNMLTIMEQKTGIGVLLNTSFNIAGKPILNTYKDAIWMLENTQMDGLILENYYIKK
jgi:carbamoyltransferase